MRTSYDLQNDLEEISNLIEAADMAVRSFDNPVRVEAMLMLLGIIADKIADVSATTVFFTDASPPA